jgi:hypothetical protein
MYTENYPRFCLFTDEKIAYFHDIKTSCDINGLICRVKTRQLSSFSRLLFTEDFVPYYFNGARPIAYADQPEVKQMLDDMEAAEITVRVTEPSDWDATSSSFGNMMEDYAFVLTIPD